MKRLPMLDIWVDAIDMERCLALVSKYVDTGNRPYSFMAVNPEKCFSVPKNSTLLEVFRRADVLFPDGIGIVWALKLLYNMRVERVPGVELMHRICAFAAKTGYSVFIYGAKEEVNKAAVEVLKRTYDGINIIGRSNGYVAQENMPELVSRINKTKAQILFLALGSPKQEEWFAKYGDHLRHVKVCQGIGGTLDVVAGTVARAPQLWRRFHMEWLYRLLAEPQRISRQKVLPLFVFRVLQKALA